MTSSNPAVAVVRRASIDVGKLISGKAGAGVASLLYMLVAVRLLGAHDYGVLILVHAFAMTVGGVLAIPGGQAVVRYGAQALAADDEPRLLRLLRFSAVIELAGGVAAIIVAAVVAPLIGHRIAWSQTAIDFALPYSFAVLATSQLTAAGYLQLRGRFDLLAVQMLVSPMVRLAGACAVWAFGGGLRELMMVWLLAALMQWAAMWAFGLLEFRRSYRLRSLVGPMRGAVRENAGYWRFILGAKVEGSLSDLGPRLTALTIGWVAGASVTALYSVAQRPTKVVSHPAKLFGQAAYAEFAKLAAGPGRKAVIWGVLLRACGILLLLTLPVLIALAFAGEFIARLIGGRAFEQAGQIILLVGIGRAIQVVAPPTAAALVALGRPGLVVIAKFAGYIAVLPLLPLLLKTYGLVGAGMQYILQALVISSLLVCFVWRQSRSGAAPRKPAADPEQDGLAMATGAAERRA